MICAIHQPNYLPYAGFFDKAIKSDLFVLYDSAQFVKNGWQNRNRICVKHGWQWLSLPVRHRFGQTIKETEIFDPEKSLKHNWNTIKTVYGKAPFFTLYSKMMKQEYCKKSLYLSEFNCDLIISIANILGIKTKFILSSDLGPIRSKGTEALIEICKKVDSSTYISGNSGKNYVDEKLFKESNIKIIYQNYNYRDYKHFNNDVFQPMMSIIDVLFNCGPKTMENIIY